MNQSVDAPETSTFRSLWHGIGGVLRYDLVRTLMPFRVALWVTMLVVPILIVAASLVLVRVRDDYRDPFVLAGLLYILLPEVVTVLCMLVWAAPIINEELESQTWIYILIRPGARRSLLLGKYLSAVLWTGCCTTCSAILATVLACGMGISGVLKVAVVIIALNWLSALSHGALFLLIGSLLPRRAMVYALIYAVGIEAMMGWVPAMINRFTLSFRLRSLLIDWLDVDLKSLTRDELPFIWEPAAATHVSVLLLTVPVLLALAIWRVNHSQFRWQSEV